MDKETIDKILSELESNKVSHEDLLILLSNLKKDMNVDIISIFNGIMSNRRPDESFDQALKRLLKKE